MTFFRFASAAVLLLLAGAAQADELTGTLKKIKETGAITLGYRDASIPFSYLDQNNKPIGFAMDICAGIVEAVKKELKDDKIQTKYIPVTSSTRIPLIANGTVDLECGSTTNNTERAKQAAFTNAHFLSESKYVTKKSSNIKSIADLRGKTVVGTAGTTNIKQANERNKAENMGMTVLFAKDHAEAFLMVETDRAAAFIMDDVLLAGFVASAKDPSLYVISSDAFSKAEPYGIMLPKNDPAFKKVVDAATSAILKTEGVFLYKKWFESPIPPRNINLTLPLSPALRFEFANPTDSPEPSVSALGTGSYAYTLLLGLKLTFLISLIAASLALALGSIAGVMRTLPSPLARRVSAAYVEFFRNIPLLVQLFLWYFVLPELLPHSVGMWLKQLPGGNFYTAAIGLGFFMSARVAEQLRAAIDAMPRGQKMAATALGLTTVQAYRYVLLPMAYRIVFPPLTSELLNTVKNSSVALTIGVAELTQSARNLNDLTFQTFQIFTAATVIYLVLNICVTYIMRFIERDIAVPGLAAGK